MNETPLELSDATELKSLQSISANRLRSGQARRRKMPGDSKLAAPYVAPADRSRGRRCFCGLCPPCLDNDRWERIFHAKFEDPEYYVRPLRRDSSLSW